MACLWLLQHPLICRDYIDDGIADGYRIFLFVCYDKQLPTFVRLGELGQWSDLPVVCFRLFDAVTYLYGCLFFTHHEVNLLAGIIVRDAILAVMAAKVYGNSVFEQGRYVVEQEKVEYAIVYKVIRMRTPEICLILMIWMITGGIAIIEKDITGR